MKKWLELILTLAPLLIGMLALWVIRDERMVSIILVAVIAGTFWVNYYENESWWLAIGILCGFALEVGGDLVYKLQYWESGLLWGIPLWLPLFWGFAFVLIRRAGNLVVKD